MTIQRDWSTGLAAGSTGIAFIGYNGTTKSAGKFDGGTTAPSNTTRLNYDGNLYATSFYGSGAGISNTTLPIASINASGTMNSTTFLRGDGSWVAVSVPVTSVVGQTGAITITQVRDALLTVDGSGSGLDADLLDGNHSSAFAHTGSAFTSAIVGTAGTGTIQEAGNVGINIYSTYGEGFFYFTSNNAYISADRAGTYVSAINNIIYFSNTGPTDQSATITIYKISKT